MLLVCLYCLYFKTSESSVAHRLDALVPSRMQPQLLQGLRAFVAADTTASSNNSSSNSRSRASSGNAVRRVWGRRLQQQQQQRSREHSNSSFGDNLSQWSEPSARQYTHYSSDAEPLWDDAAYSNNTTTTAAGAAAAAAAGARARSSTSSNGRSSHSHSNNNYDLVAWESADTEGERRGKGASPPLPPVASPPALQYEITLYIQMALCRGLTLQQWLQRRNARVAAAAVAARAHAAKCCSSSSAASTTGDAASVSGSESSRSPLLPPPPWPEQCADSSAADSCADSCSASCSTSSTAAAATANGNGHLPLDTQRSLRSTLAARAVRNSANAAAASFGSNISSSCNGHSYAAASSSASQQCNGSSSNNYKSCSSSSSSEELPHTAQQQQQSSAVCPHCGYAQQETEVDLTEAVAILKALASGLVHVHARSIIHRDLKPENVFILPDGSVKIGTVITVTAIMIIAAVCISSSRMYECQRVTCACDSAAVGSIKSCVGSIKSCVGSIKSCVADCSVRAVCCVSQCHNRDYALLVTHLQQAILDSALHGHPTLQRLAVLLLLLLLVKVVAVVADVTRQCTVTHH
jgi:Protein kinase domain